MDKPKPKPKPEPKPIDIVKIIRNDPFFLFI